MCAMHIPNRIELGDSSFPKTNDDRRIKLALCKRDRLRPDSHLSSPHSSRQNSPSQFVQRIDRSISTCQGKVLLLPTSTAPPREYIHLHSPIPSFYVPNAKKCARSSQCPTKKCSNAQRVIVQARRRNFFSSPRKPCSQKKVPRRQFVSDRHE